MLIPDIIGEEAGGGGIVDNLKSLYFRAVANCFLSNLVRNYKLYTKLNQLASLSCLLNEADEFKEIKDHGHQNSHFISNVKFICTISCLPKIHTENIL